MSALDSTARSHKIFVGGLAFGTDDDKLREYFNAFGTVEDAVVMKDMETKRSRGFGFVTFVEADDLDNVLRNAPLELDGRKIEARKAVPREHDESKANGKNKSQKGDKENTSGNTSAKKKEFNKKNKRMSDDDLKAQGFEEGDNDFDTADIASNKIFVGGLHADTKESDLKKYFDKYGTIVRADVMFNKETKKSRNFGFVLFESEAAVESVVKDGAHTIGDKKIEVRKSIPRNKISTSPTTAGGSNAQRGEGEKETRESKPPSQGRKDPKVPGVSPGAIMGSIGQGGALQRNRREAAAMVPEEDTPEDGSEDTPVSTGEKTGAWGKPVNAPAHWPGPAQPSGGRESSDTDAGKKAGPPVKEVFSYAAALKKPVPTPAPAPAPAPAPMTVVDAEKKEGGVTEGEVEAGDSGKGKKRRNKKDKDEKKEKKEVDTPPPAPVVESAWLAAAKGANKPKEKEVPVTATTTTTTSEDSVEKAVDDAPVETSPEQAEKKEPRNKREKKKREKKHVDDSGDKKGEEAPAATATDELIESNGDLPSPEESEESTTTQAKQTAPVDPLVQGGAPGMAQNTSPTGMPAIFSSPFEGMGAGGWTNAGIGGLGLNLAAAGQDWLASTNGLDGAGLDSINLTGMFPSGASDAQALLGGETSVGADGKPADSNANVDATKQQAGNVPGMPGVRAIPPQTFAGMPGVAQYMAYPNAMAQMAAPLGWPGQPQFGAHPGLGGPQAGLSQGNPYSMPGAGIPPFPQQGFPQQGFPGAQPQMTPYAGYPPGTHPGPMAQRGDYRQFGGGFQGNPGGGRRQQNDNYGNNDGHHQGGGGGRKHNNNYHNNERRNDYNQNVYAQATGYPQAAGGMYANPYGQAGGMYNGYPPQPSYHPYAAYGQHPGMQHPQAGQRHPQQGGNPRGMGPQGGQQGQQGQPQQGSQGQDAAGNQGPGGAPKSRREYQNQLSALDGILPELSASSSSFNPF